MSDIFGETCRQAAAEIALLRAEIERLRAALERIELAETDYSNSTDHNMERLRSIARAALAGVARPASLRAGTSC